ncbi:MAG TPA: hypothetical protein VNI84_15450 [Pyrinomonadaceae bacterium]|nr:hypothetical protein [Pyrinomonadaceae bacterium]
METVFACNMNALDKTQRGRYNTITQTLKDARQELQELDDGYAFRFKAESQLILDAAEFIVYERLCCPFFDFELSVENANDSLWLRLRGQVDIKEFIRSEFNINL